MSYPPYTMEFTFDELRVIHSLCQAFICQREIIEDDDPITEEVCGIIVDIMEKTGYVLSNEDMFNFLHDEARKMREEENRGQSKNR